MEKEKFFSTRRITWLAILLALVITLQSLSGFMVVGGVEINLTLVPVVLGAMILGPACGAIIGFVSGVITLLFGIFGWAALTSAMFNYSPILTSLICLSKCTLAGFVGGIIYNLVKKKNKYVSTFVTSAIVPFINTTIFVIGACFFKQVFVEFKLAESSQFILWAILGLIAINFIVELAINLILAPAIFRVSEIVEKKSY
jgi:uncharacterized membrane protein